MNPFLRTALHTWFRLSRGLTVGVRAAAFDGDGRVCLIRHTYWAGWHLPGGGVETGETALEAITRELAEEAAVELTAPPTLHGIFFNAAVSKRDHILVYVARDVRSAAKVPDREIAEAGFFPLAALPDGTTAGTRSRLREIASGERPSARW